MKRVLIATAVLAALPLLAEETAQKPAEPKPKPAESQVVSPVPAESPFAAAVRKSRKPTGKKRIVITDAMVKDSKGGHITTTTIQPQFNPDPPKPSKEAEMIAAQAKEKAALAEKSAAEVQKAEAEKKKIERRARAAEMEEGAEAGYGETDPAESGKPEQEENPKKPQ
ncbi:MAG: hypothetical protein JJE51_02845 [Thermoanaerobaculia bacterium]|nr:hypothetical protein [Thermoanaerobaculia bacterium]